MEKDEAKVSLRNVKFQNKIFDSTFLSRIKSLLMEKNVKIHLTNGTTSKINKKHQIIQFICLNI